MNPLKHGSRSVMTAAVVIASMAAVVVIAVFAFGGAKQLTAPFRGETDKKERTEASGAFRLATYEEFFELCAAVQDAEGNARSLEKELKTKPPRSRVTQINSSLTAVRNSRTASINSYNSKAGQEHRAAFKDADLPARLDHTAKETACTA